MILDTISNAKQYKGIHPGIDRILKAVQTYTAENYPSGRMELDGDDLFMIFSQYETHPKEGAVTEAHEQYVDVMYMVEGSENIYVKPVQQLQNITKEYDPEIEALLAGTDDDATVVRLEKGSFIVLFPQDAHAPACDADGKKYVKKIIGKVRITV